MTFDINKPLSTDEVIVGVLCDIREAVRALKPDTRQIDEMRALSERYAKHGLVIMRERDDLQEEVEGLQAVAADRALTIATLKDELGAARTAEDIAHRVVEAQEDELGKLRDENAAIRKSIGDGDYGPTAAELQRFRDRDAAIRDLAAAGIGWAEVYRDFEVTP